MSDPLAGFEKLGEAGVREKLARGEYGSKGINRQMAEDWLRKVSASRASILDARKQTMDTIALIAAIVAAVAATIGAIASIILLFR